ncbi:MAG: DUF3301 domain-containing protein [Gammaproteobacteria bacterium]
MLVHIILIILLISAGCYWASAQAVKEQALSTVKTHCQAMDVQMLDGYVALDHLALKRDAAGTVRISRVFLFEFSANGTDRYNGHISMLGQSVEAIYMDPYRLS